MESSTNWSCVTARGGWTHTVIFGLCTAVRLLIFTWEWSTHSAHDHLNFREHYTRRPEENLRSPGLWQRGRACRSSPPWQHTVRIELRNHHNTITHCVLSRRAESMSNFVKLQILLSLYSVQRSIEDNQKVKNIFFRVKVCLKSLRWTIYK